MAFALPIIGVGNCAALLVVLLLMHRCFFLWGILHHLAGLDPAAAAAAGDAAAQAVEAARCNVSAETAANPVASTSADATGPAVSPLLAAGSAGVLASVAGKLGLGAADLVDQHSLDGMRFRAFDPQTGVHYATMVRRMVSWPLFRPGAEILGVAADLVLGLLPSFVWRTNRGIWTLWEGQAARGNRALRRQRGFLPQH